MEPQNKTGELLRKVQLLRVQGVAGARSSGEFPGFRGSYPKAPCIFIVDTWALKGLPYHNFGVYVYTIKLHGARWLKSGICLLIFCPSSPVAHIVGSWEYWYFRGTKEQVANIGNWASRVGYRYRCRYRCKSRERHAYTA